MVNQQVDIFELLSLNNINPTDKVMDLYDKLKLSTYVGKNYFNKGYAVMLVKHLCPNNHIYYQKQSLNVVPSLDAMYWKKDGVKYYHIDSNSTELLKSKNGSSIGSAFGGVLTEEETIEYINRYSKNKTMITYCKHCNWKHQETRSHQYDYDTCQINKEITNE